MSQSNTTSQYYLQWETPANHGDIDLDHYELCIAENLVQKVHPEQRYAVIDVYSGFTAVVRLAAIDKCGQVSNYSQISITPTNHSDSGMENIVTSVTTATARDDQGTSSPILSLVLIPVICSCIIALVSMFLAILCTVILIRHKHHPVPDSDTDGRVRLST